MVLCRDRVSEREKRRYHAFMFYKDYWQRSGWSLADAQQLYREQSAKQKETEKLRRRQLDSATLQSLTGRTDCLSLSIWV